MMKFSTKDFFSNWTNPNFPVDLVTFTKEMFNGKFHFLCSIWCYMLINAKTVWSYKPTDENIISRNFDDYS